MDVCMHNDLDKQIRDAVMVWTFWSCVYLLMYSSWSEMFQKLVNRLLTFCDQYFMTIHAVFRADMSMNNELLINMFLILHKSSRDTSITMIQKFCYWDLDYSEKSMLVNKIFQAWLNSSKLPAMLANPKLKKIHVDLQNMDFGMDLSWLSIYDSFMTFLKVPCIFLIYELVLLEWVELHCLQPRLVAVKCIL